MSKSGHPKFLGLTLTANGGMLGAWEDGSVARWVPQRFDYVGEVEVTTAGHWIAIPSPDYETLFCTTMSRETAPVEPTSDIAKEIASRDFWYSAHQEREAEIKALKVELKAIAGGAN